MVEKYVKNVERFIMCKKIVENVEKTQGKVNFLGYFH